MTQSNRINTVPPEPKTLNETMTHLTIQSIINSVRVRRLTCSLQYTLRHAYIAANPPVNEYPL